MKWLVSILTILLLVLPLLASEPDDAAEDRDASRNDWLVGAHRSDVIAALGPPTRVKRRSGRSVMVYKFGDSGLTWIESDGCLVPVDARIVTDGAGDSTRHVHTAITDGDSPAPATALPPRHDWRIPNDAPLDETASSIRRLEVHLGSDDLVASWNLGYRKHKNAGKLPKSKRPVSD